MLVLSSARKDEGLYLCILIIRLTSNMPYMLNTSEHAAGRAMYVRGARTGAYVEGKAEQEENWNGNRNRNEKG